jgi:alkanesulfonate monooxygenase SsuD/methylene tetrahydromethanopterin reductase-like flavin-dependent oxidoreductase (luciferase family)
MEFGIFDHLDKGRDAPLADLYEDRLKMVERYEAAGIYCYHLAEHHATPLGMAPSPSVFLAAVAQRTTKMLFGPLVYILPLYEPLRLVEEICMLDNLSRGRFQLGIGRGISILELGHYGLAHPEIREIYDESLDVLLKALSSEVLNHKGDRFRYTNFPMELRPVQTPHPPLWYGAGSPGSAEWSARMKANIVINAPASVAAPLIGKFKETWAEHHGDEKLPMMGITRQTYVAETDAEAEARGRPAFDAWFDSFAKLWRAFGSNPMRYPDNFDDARRAGVITVGSPETVRAEIAEQEAESGCNYFVSRMAYGDLTFEESARSLDLFASEVMPHFRD